MKVAGKDMLSPLNTITNSDKLSYVWMKPQLRISLLQQ